MAKQDYPQNYSMPDALPTFNQPTLQQPPKKSQLPNSRRRHSLPLNYLQSGPWGANTPSASLVQSEEAARGEHILDEATLVHRISALRQLNGATIPRHQYAKSVGARNSTFSQPVIVRTYSGGARPRSQQIDIVTMKKGKGRSSVAAGNIELKLPPVDAFSFKRIMYEIRHDVAEDLEIIAEICARSKYSLSNEYEVHMAPHGSNDNMMDAAGLVTGNLFNSGPTLQAIGSDEEQIRHAGPRSRGTRRSKSMAYGTLETIISSSKSSDEEKMKKKPAAVIAEEVRGRVAINSMQVQNDSVKSGLAETLSKHARSKSGSFVSMIINCSTGFRWTTGAQTTSPALISEPARPQTSTATAADIISNCKEFYDNVFPALHSFMPKRPSLIRNKSIASTLRPEVKVRLSILGKLTSWLIWTRAPTPSSSQRMSHAEDSLRELLKCTHIDPKGKGVDRFD